MPARSRANGWRSSQPTYEELKQNPKQAPSPSWARSQPTYEELKLFFPPFCGF